MVGPSMSLGDASGGRTSALAAGPGLCCALLPAIESASAINASAAQVRRTDIRITDARGGAQKRLCRPILLLFECEHEQGAGILRHAFEGFAPQRRKLVGH